MNISGGQFYILGALLILTILLIFIERKSSVKILLRAILTIVILYFVLIRGVTNGHNFIILSGTTVFLISFVNIFIKDGIHQRSFAELLSVLFTSFFTCTVIFIICFVTKIDLGYKDKVLDLTGIFGSKSLVFSMSIIALLGIYMDIISRITMRLDDEKNKTEDIKMKEQFKIGMTIGKEFISEKINMLFLIFIGVAILPICGYISNGYNIMEIFNVSSIFIIFIIAIVGNIGLVLSIPITSFLYAMLNRKKTIYKTVSENKINGKRSLKL